MNIKIIACRVFEPELGVILGSEDPAVDYLPLRAHDDPDSLRAEIQQRIDASDDFDLIVLAYGLCGNAIAGLKAGSVPLCIPMAHDCSQILLGGNAQFEKYFKDNPSRGWTSRGYLAGDEDSFREDILIMGWDMKLLIEQYGEENARYVWETMHSTTGDDPVLYYLDVPETQDPASLERAKNKAKELGKQLEIIPATLKLLSRLLAGRGGAELLMVPPGQTIVPSWDDQVMAASVEGSAL